MTTVLQDRKDSMTTFCVPGSGDPVIFDQTTLDSRFAGMTEA